MVDRFVRSVSSTVFRVPPRVDGCWLQVQVNRAQHDRIRAYCARLRLPILTWARAIILTDAIEQPAAVPARSRALRRVRGQDHDRTVLMMRCTGEQRRAILARAESLNEAVSAYGRRVLLAEVSRAEVRDRLLRLRETRRKWGFA